MFEANDIKLYIKSLHKYFQEFNKNPVTEAEVKVLKKDRSDETYILYYWLFVNKWNGIYNKYEILSQIHDMWSLNLFIEYKIVKKNKGNVYKLAYKVQKPSQNDKEVIKLSDIKKIKFMNGPSPQKDEWYSGDLINCKIYNRDKSITQVKRNIHNTEAFNKHSVIFINPIGGSFMLEFRRLSQLVPFQNLTKQSKKQDEPFYIQNVSLFEEIQSSTRRT